MRTSQMILALVSAGTLALGAGTALAASGSSATESAKAPAAPAATPTEKSPVVKTETKESPVIQKAEQKGEAREERGEKQVTGDRVAEGVVTHVEPQASPATLVMKTMQGKEALIVGVDVPANTVIREGKAAKKLEDIKVGDRVWMRWDRMNNRLVADQIHILKANSTAAMKTAPTAAKSESPMAAKAETSKKNY